MDYLNRDISDKIPNDKMRRIQEEEKKIVDRKL